MSKSLGLIKHQLHKVNADAFDIRPKKVEAWVAALPMGNIGETARLVYNVLVDTNKLQYSYQYRTRFLEIMREPIEYITTGMKKHFIGAKFPLPEKSQKVAAIAREVYTEMALGYKIAMEDMISSNSIFPDNRLLALLIHRTMSSLSQELLTSYQIYAPHRKNIWQECHRIYSFAVSKKLQRIGIVAPSSKPAIKTTISDEYKRLLLLSLTSPYCLRHGEVNKIYTAIAKWTNLVEIKNSANHNYNQGFFAVNLESDKAPRYLTTKPTELYPSAQYQIVTDKLILTLQKQLLQSENSVSTTLMGLDLQSNELSHELLQKLLTCWGEIPKRVFPRTSTQEKISIAMGLNSAHHIILGTTRKPHQHKMTQNNSGQFIAPAKFASTAVVDVSTPEQDIWDMVYPTHTAVKPVIDSESKNTPLENEELLNEHYRADQAWEIINQSAGGYCIRCTKDCAVKVQVGELIGLQHKNDGDSAKWGVGVIRWMKFNNKRILILGIQMITPDATAAGVKITASDENYQRTLVLPELSAIKQPATLITPPVPYRVGSKVLIKVQGKKIQVELTKQLVNTGLFAQFQFTPVKHSSTNNNRIEKEDMEFSSVWSSI